MESNTYTLNELTMTPQLNHNLLQCQSKDIQNWGSHNLSTVVKDDTRTPLQC